MFVTSVTSPYTRSGAALMSMLTSSMPR